MSEQWGIQDTVDNLWIGDSTGPFLYDAEILARIAAQIYDEMVGNDEGRTRAQEFTAAVGRIRDKVEAKMSPEEAVQRLEGRKDA